MIVEPAPVWKRLLAWVYDGLILTALWLVSGLVAALLAGGEAPPWLVRTIVLMSSVAYFGWSWKVGGKTAGMRAWRLRVVRVDGQTAHLVRHRPPNGGLARLPGANRCHAIHRMGAPAPPDNL